jgi:anti-sigma regulatory factor (Ser/Thr protein kinase)
MKVTAAFPADVATLAMTRRFVGSALEGLGVTEEQLDSAVLVTNELASNAMCHAGEEDVLVRLSCDGRRLRIEVHDRGDGESVNEDTGEFPAWSGLNLVESHCTQWGVEKTATGKQVWAVLDFDAGCAA